MRDLLAIATTKRPQEREVGKCQTGRIKVSIPHFQFPNTPHACHFRGIHVDVHAPRPFRRHDIPDFIFPSRETHVTTYCGRSGRRAALGHSHHVRPEEPGRPPPNVTLKTAVRFPKKEAACAEFADRDGHLPLYPCPMFPS